MKKQKIHMSKYFILIFCSILFSCGLFAEKTDAFSNQVIQKGAVGDDVIELQSRLQYIGYYNGKIDGVFGWSTYWALRNFQYEYGLPIDGLAGWPTKLKLAKASKYNEQFVKKQIEKGGKFSHYGGVGLEKQKQPDRKTPTPAVPQNGKTPASPSKKPAQPNAPAPAQPKTQIPAQPTPTAQKKQPANAQPKAETRKPTATNTPNGFSQNDIQLMANAVYGESRGEPYTGQVAVAAVILNRVESANFPDTVSGVIFEPGAFTAVADGQIWLTPNDGAKKAVIDAINGLDPTGNAIYYFNPETATSKWIWSRPQIKRIGKHIFCK
ncbi:MULTISPECIES: spore cortex-lytic enzyme [unclassified Bacillus (in: firmicutes)]|uniref:spore cortex-lytic enzyme n=1 Tax=unclassified Bacillus (in: firmicutes) TaxID=185979 RepID=UPI0008F1B1A1|nr:MULTISPECIES: spore cortex-lytic enzyme [unclassified Bacillus (in: firmicutes)]SFA98247.1 N-acetylmuramoyl-L-alanine amidase [Bacillus sp. UNCCL13]SFQ80913.1 N-acetylmuramoyl-L-alanine amidase [Bacillus sp. cl95]